MCLIKQTITRINGETFVDLLCHKTDKPITQAGDHSMYCDDLCGLEEDHAAVDARKARVASVIDSVEW